jgi:hypothetical protein
MLECTSISWELARYLFNHFNDDDDDDDDDVEIGEELYRISIKKYTFCV